jgi:hypothetical protein
MMPLLTGYHNQQWCFLVVWLLLHCHQKAWWSDDKQIENGANFRNRDDCTELSAKIMFRVCGTRKAPWRRRTIGFYEFGTGLPFCEILHTCGFFSLTILLNFYVFSIDQLLFPRSGSNANVSGWFRMWEKKWI